MDLVSILKIVVNRLDVLKIPYLLTGGLAVSFWGLPRTTHDIDIVIEAKKEDGGKIVDIFKKDFYISKEAVDLATDQRFTFNIIHFKSGLKVDFWLTKKDAHKALEFKRKLNKKIFDRKISIITPEDLILEKLLWYKEGGGSRHLDDVKGIIQISRPDLVYIKSWAEKQSTIDILEEILKNNE